MVTIMMAQIDCRGHRRAQAVSQPGARYVALAFMAVLLTAAAGADRGFDESTHPAAPDYHQAANWAARGEGPARPVDMFYIQPTTFRSKLWNQDVADAAVNVWTDTSVTGRQLSVFADCCRLYQPRYRQASSRAFYEMDGDGTKAYTLAYQDVRRAFAAFLRRTGGRPFMIAGHSQGGLHALHLLEDEIAGKPLARRLVVTYVLGIGVPTGLFGSTALPGMAPCDMPRQAGCVVSWNSFLPTADVADYVAREGRRYSARFGDSAGTALLCVNPLTFDRRIRAAPAAANRGALLGPLDAGPLPAPIPAAASAECAEGVLRVSPTPAAGTIDPLPNNSLHMYDITLFWTNLRDDADSRAAAFRDRKAG